MVNIKNHEKLKTDHRYKIGKEDIKVIISRFKKGMTNISSAEIFGVSRERIRQIIYEKLKQARQPQLNQRYDKLIPEIIKLVKKGNQTKEAINYVIQKYRLNLNPGSIQHAMRKRGIRNKDIKVKHLCKEKGCNNIEFAKGFCTKHYLKWRYNTFPEVREAVILYQKKYIKKLAAKKQKSKK